MLRNNFVFLSLLLINNYSFSQENRLSSPVEIDYSACAFSPTEDCEIRLKMKHGLATCDDIKWTYLCRVDEINDDKECFAKAPNSHLVVFSKKGKVSFSVVGDDFPGKRSSIRIDKNPAISYLNYSGTTRAQDSAIESQIKKGKTVVTRYIEWPSGFRIDEKILICNLPEVIKSMKINTK